MYRADQFRVKASSEIYACSDSLGIKLSNNELILITKLGSGLDWSLIGEVVNKNVVPTSGRGISNSEINDINYAIKSCMNKDGKKLIDKINEFNPNFKQ